jgi:asparagine synthase (glutamine-hydrolysing)
MCGIFCLLNNDNEINADFIKEQFRKGKNRGPEYSKLTNVSIKALFGFHRLAINGLNAESNQPLVHDDVTLICNGEIYNYKELYKMLGITPNTDSDCEVIIHLYKKYGIEYTLKLLDGVFAFVLCDNKLSNEDSHIYIARDPYGIRPLYILKDKGSEKTIPTTTTKITTIPKIKSKSKIVGFASEIKVLSEFTKLEDSNFTIEHFKPGTYSSYSQKFKVMTKWNFDYEKQYHSNCFNMNPYTGDLNKEIQHYLISAVKKRVLVTDRPIACLLSGGLDSSLITALVNQVHKTVSDKKLETYSIGLEGSEDLKYAKIVADYLGTKHTEILLTEQDFLDAIPEVIYTIESYDTTSVRASIGNYLLGKYISENSDAKVIFNGDGSDELCGGYLYMHKAPNEIEFDYECRRLLKDIHAFDVLRSDKCISSHGLEPRTPFLDRSWVQFYLSIEHNLRFHPGLKQCEKFLLRNAFCKENFKNDDDSQLLPDEIIWRKKEAFSDGVSKTTRSLYEIIQEYAENVLKIPNEILYEHNQPKTTEQQYYRAIFEFHYKNIGNVVPYYWMPRYINATDASARTLEFYNSPSKSETEL